MELFTEFPKMWRGLAAMLVLALPAWFLGSYFEVVGGPVFAIVLGMLCTLVVPAKRSSKLAAGVKFTSKKVLQWAVILLGFGLNLGQIARVGVTSLPVIVATISTALIVSFVLAKVLKIPSKIATLVGVGSSICGGSAIAATAPVIDADDAEIAQAISVIFLFNVIAALIFPTLGGMLGLSNAGFGLFAGTAVNDTSSVTAAAAAWDGMHPGANALDFATIVKLTRTLAIIPITVALAVWQSCRQSDANTVQFSFRRTFPTFILFFVVASLITTLFVLPPQLVQALKTLSKFLIVLAMAAIGFNTNLVKLVKSGTKPLVLGLVCWVAIAVVSLGAQHVIGLW